MSNGERIIKNVKKRETAKKSLGIEKNMAYTNGSWNDSHRK